MISACWDLGNPGDVLCNWGEWNVFEACLLCDGCFPHVVQRTVRPGIDTFGFSHFCCLPFKNFLGEHWVQHRKAVSFITMKTNRLLPTPTDRVFLNLYVGLCNTSCFSCMSFLTNPVLGGMRPLRNLKVTWQFEKRGLSLEV